LQKKTAAVAGDVSEGADEEGSEEVQAKPKKGAKRKAPVDEVEEPEDEDTKPAKPSKPQRARKKVEKVKEDSEEEEEKLAPVAKKVKKEAKDEVKSEDTNGRRRSGRLLK
jgi:hypothetical protein